MSFQKQIDLWVKEFSVGIISANDLRGLVGRMVDAVYEEGYVNGLEAGMGQGMDIVREVEQSFRDEGRI